MTTFPYGYSTPVAMLTKPQIAAKPKVAMVDPELMRRVFALMEEAALVGVKLGIGGAGRIDGDQDVLFRRRHTASDTDLPPCNRGAYQYLNRCWTLNPGMAAAAVPGSSYHEATTPAKKALALDMVGDMHWMDGKLKAYGLYNFDSEPWHIQPVEIPAARKDYIAAKHALKIFPLPQPAQPVPPPPPAPTSPLPFSPDAVVPGSSGESVFLCQTILRYCAAQVLIVPTGYYDDATKTGISNVQRLFGLFIDGKAGPKTWPYLIFLSQTTQIEDPS